MVVFATNGVIGYKGEVDADIPCCGTSGSVGEDGGDGEIAGEVGIRTTGQRFEFVQEIEHAGDNLAGGVDGGGDGGVPVFYPVGVVFVQFPEFVELGVGLGIGAGEVEGLLLELLELGEGLFEKILVAGEGFFAEGIVDDHAGESSAESGGDGANCAPAGSGGFFSHGV